MRTKLFVLLMLRIPRAQRLRAGRNPGCRPSLETIVEDCGCQGNPDR